MKRWGEHRSVFNDRLHKKIFDPLKRDVEVDTVIVGAGITGLTAAYLLTKAGKKVAVVTAGAVGEGTTGFSTGHLTEVFDEDFETLISDFGLSSMQNVAGSVRESINLIEKISSDNGIDCQFSRLASFKFTENDSEIEKLQKEMKLAQSLGLEAKPFNINPFNYRAVGAIRFDNQAQFNPLGYLYGLSEALEKMGCLIFEESRVLKIEDAQPAYVHTTSGSISAKDVILATHTPVGLYVSLHTRLAPYFSYVVGVKLENPYPDGLYYDTSDPYFYLRPHQKGSDVWIIGGRDHKTGQEEHPYERYLQLENYVRDRFKVKEMVCYWGDELYESVDGLPYIGKIPFTKALFTGTGYAGTGLTWGTVAAQVITDEILGRVSALTTIYSPSRVKPLASAGSFVKENFNVAKHFVTDRFTHVEMNKLSVIPPEEGRVVDFDGKKIAAYRDVTNHIHMLSATCTHLGCTVNWNNADKTWDCPCHGGRFKCTGETFEGPPLKNLQDLGLNSLKVENDDQVNNRSPISNFESSLELT